MGMYKKGGGELIEKKVSEQNRKILKKSLVVLSLTFTANLYAHNSDWSESNLSIYSDCFDFKEFNDPKKINPSLLSTVCFFLTLTNRTYYNHSDYRPLRSEHHSGNALDFRVHSYKGMNQKERLVQYLEDIEDLQSFLDLTGLTNKIGWGIYPKTNNPFFHLDLRGKRARWSEINGKEVSFELGFKYIKSQITDKADNASL